MRHPTHISFLKMTCVLDFIFTLNLKILLSGQFMNKSTIGLWSTSNSNQTMHPFYSIELSVLTNSNTTLPPTFKIDQYLLLDHFHRSNLRVFWHPKLVLIVLQKISEKLWLSSLRDSSATFLCKNPRKKKANREFCNLFLNANN